LQRILSAFGLFAGLLCAQQSAWAQDEPPRPVDELIAAFEADPSDRGTLILVLSDDCAPAAGTWQYEYLTGLMTLPPRGAVEESLASSFSVALGLCEGDLLSGWLRAFLERADDGFVVQIAAAALGRSGTDENRLAALQAMFDLRYSDETRLGIGWEWVEGQDSPALGHVQLVAEAYQRVSGAPSALLHTVLSALRFQEGDALRFRGARRLLDVVSARPEAEGSVVVMSSLFNSAAGLPLDNPWLVEFRAVAEEFATGQRPAPPALYALIWDRMRYFCRGATPRYQNGRCEPAGR